MYLRRRWLAKKRCYHHRGVKILSSVALSLCAGVLIDVALTKLRTPFRKPCFRHRHPFSVLTPTLSSSKFELIGLKWKDVVSEDDTFRVRSVKSPAYSLTPSQSSSQPISCHRRIENRVNVGRRTTQIQQHLKTYRHHERNKVQLMKVIVSHSTLEIDKQHHTEAVRTRRFKRLLRMSWNKDD